MKIEANIQVLHKKLTELRSIVKRYRSGDSSVSRSDYIRSKKEIPLTLNLLKNI